MYNNESQYVVADCGDKRIIKIRGGREEQVFKNKKRYSRKVKHRKGWIDN